MEDRTGDNVDRRTLPGLSDSLVTPPNSCTYLPQQTARLEVRQSFRMTPMTYDSLLQRGWRRQGIVFFRPVCPVCQECRSLRVQVADFKPSKSQRRTLKRNTDVSLEVGKPTLTERHIEIFNAYHEDMHGRRGWVFSPIESVDYATTFLAGKFDFAREFRFYRRAKLSGVGLVDVTRHSSSSVYFYHDPSWRPMAPGVFSMLTEIRYAEDLKLTHHYLGYWIADNPSMSYKSKYRPHEILSETFDDRDAARWIAEPS